MVRKQRPGDRPVAAEGPSPKTREYYLMDSNTKPQTQIQRSRKERDSTLQTAMSLIPTAPKATPCGGGPVARRTTLPASHCCPTVVTPSADAPPTIVDVSCPSPIPPSGDSLKQNCLDMEIVQISDMFSGVTVVVNEHGKTATPCAIATPRLHLEGTLTVQEDDV